MHQDRLSNGHATDSYREGYERIWGKKKKKKASELVKELSEEIKQELKKQDGS